jgi:D-amino-acid oxidase
VTSTRPDVVIVGAGVSGLTTGARLAECGVRVRIRAEQSPWESNSAAAGAIWDPIYANHPSVPVWSERTYDAFVRMVAEDRPGVHLVEGVEASRTPIPSPAWAFNLPAYRACAPDELPPGVATGWRYRAPIIDMPPCLRWLEQRLLAARWRAGAGAAADA